MISSLRSRMVSSHTAAVVESIAVRLSSGIASAAVMVLKPLNTISTYVVADDEAEAMGVPYGSELPDVVVNRMAGASLWKFDVWVNEGNNSDDRCLNVRAFGHWIEIFYTPKAHCLPAGAA